MTSFMILKMMSLLEVVQLKKEREKKVICACGCVIWGTGGGTGRDRIKGR